MKATRMKESNDEIKYEQQCDDGNNNNDNSQLYQPSVVFNNSDTLLAANSNAL